MKLDLTRDGVTVEAGRADADLARATADTLESAFDLANAVGARKCERCDSHGRLRGYDIIIDGEFQVLQICAACQQDWVQEAASNHHGGVDNATVGDGADD